MTKIEVTGCFGCPFYQHTDYSVNDPMHCWVTDEEETVKFEFYDPRYREPRFMPNCPLKEGKVVVELKTQMEENKNG